jgi:hypothetical protein
MYWQNGVRKKIMKPSKFNENDKVRVIHGNFKGLEGVISGKDSAFDGWMYDIKVVRSVPEIGFADSVDFGEEYLELVTPDIREVGKKIEPELVKVGDRIRAVRVADDSGIESSKSGIVHEKKNYCGTISFWTHGKHELNRIGYADDQNSHYILEEETAIHELTLKPVGTKFKAVRGPGAYYYLIYTKVREGYWTSESFDVDSGKFVQIAIKSEKSAIKEFDKGRSTYL